MMLGLVVVTIVGTGIGTREVAVRPFVLAAATAFAVVVMVGGLAPMLRLDKQPWSRRRGLVRVLRMSVYAALCLLLLWAYWFHR